MANLYTSILHKRITSQPHLQCSINKVVPVPNHHAMTMYMIMEVKSTLLLTSNVHGFEWSDFWSNLFASKKLSPVPLGWESGWDIKILLRWWHCILKVHSCKNCLISWKPSNYIVYFHPHILLRISLMNQYCANNTCEAVETTLCFVRKQNATCYKVTSYSNDNSPNSHSGCTQYESKPSPYYLDRDFSGFFSTYRHILAGNIIFKHFRLLSLY